MNAQDLANLHNQAKEHEVSQEALAILRLCEVVSESQGTLVDCLASLEDAINKASLKLSAIEMNLRPKPGD